MLILRVGVGTAPFESGGSVSSHEQIVRTEEYLFLTQIAQFSEQLLSILHVCIIWLVGAEKAVDRTEGTKLSVCVHLDGNRKARHIRVEWIRFRIC